MRKEKLNQNVNSKQVILISRHAIERYKERICVESNDDEIRRFYINGLKYGRKYEKKYSFVNNIDFNNNYNNHGNSIFTYIRKITIIYNNVVFLAIIEKNITKVITCYGTLRYYNWYNKRYA